MVLNDVDLKRWSYGDHGGLWIVYDDYSVIYVLVQLHVPLEPEGAADPLKEENFEL